MTSTLHTVSFPLTEGPALIAHGGAGTWSEAKLNPASDGLEKAIAEGSRVLSSGGSALDAVCATVRVLEDNPLFNAGTGAALNLDGEAELDAGVMVSTDEQAGGVCSIRDVRHPIDVARAVMEQTDHVLLAGEGATHFARTLGFEPWDPRTDDRLRVWEERLAHLRESGDGWLPRLRALIRKHPELCRGTVGAAAVDAQGVLAAATSTGGVVLKLQGRVGDACVPGAGNYANRHAASSATGRGEFALRSLTTRSVAEAVAQGHTLADATRKAIADVALRFGPEMGLISVSATGALAASHATLHMPIGWWSDSLGIGHASAGEAEGDL